LTESYFSYHFSPAGWLEIKVLEKYVQAVSFVENKKENSSHQPLLAKVCIRQLDEYFTGKRKKFDLPVLPSGTTFQFHVWNELDKIPYGETISYHELAIRLGDEKVIRAAAHANAKNPLAIIIPCHRVIGSDGSLTGYAGGLKRKQWLLDHEAKVTGKYRKLF